MSIRFILKTKYTDHLNECESKKKSRTLKTLEPLIDHKVESFGSRYFTSIDSLQKESPFLRISNKKSSLDIGDYDISYKKYMPSPIIKFDRELLNRRKNLNVKIIIPIRSQSSIHTKALFFFSENTSEEITVQIFTVDNMFCISEFKSYLTDGFSITYGATDDFPHLHKNDYVISMPFVLTSGINPRF